MGLFFLAVIVFVLADVAIRFVAGQIKEGKTRKERAEALKVSLTLDFSREAKSLKRSEVVNPKARILCVDDEDVILDSFRKILVLEGYCVDTVNSGKEALGLVQSQQYDFVFTDLKMPEMDGVEVAKAVKYLRPDIDVIIITGFASVETAVETMKFGATDYVQKPFTEDELLEFLKKALIKRQDRLQKQLRPSVCITHDPAAVQAQANEFSIPGGVFISDGHCWVALMQDGGAKVGIDDFARKLIGPFDGIEFPKPGMSVAKGQPLFSVRQKSRMVPFMSPVTGKVSRINNLATGELAKPGTSPYGNNWVCLITADNLDPEVRTLKIGNSAAVFFQDEIERLIQQSVDRTSSAKGELRTGAMEQFTNAEWDKTVAAFFSK